MDLEDKAVREICPYAQYRNDRRGEQIYCEIAKGKNSPSGFEFIGIKKGEVCVATTFFSTGHSYSGARVDVKEMENCPYRNSK